MRRTRAALAAALLALAVPAAAQYPGDARLGEAKQLAGAMLRALERCVQSRAPGASCRLADVARLVGVDPDTGSALGGRWMVSPDSALTLSGGSPPGTAGTIAITGVAARGTGGLALALHARPTGNVFRCELRSGIPPGPGGGEVC